jgi:hypothetical protein
MYGGTKAISFTLRPVYPLGKNLWWPQDMRLDSKRRRSRHYEDEINITALSGMEPDSSAIHPVAVSILTPLFKIKPSANGVP